MDGVLMENIQKLDWEDFKVGCPCNPQYAKKVLHHSIPEIKCNATGFACDPVSCPFLFWESMKFTYGDRIFSLLEKVKQ